MRTPTGFRPIFTSHLGLRLSATVLGVGLLAGSPVFAATVLTNQLDKKIGITLKIGEGDPVERELDPQEVFPIHEEEEIILGFTAGGRSQVHRLKNHTLYYIAEHDEQVGLFVFAAPEEEEVPAPWPATPVEPPVRPGEMLTIPVKILVDQKQNAREERWRRDLERCVEAASRIFEKTARVEFKVVAAERWHSQSDVTDFAKASEEFRRKVKPDPARIAIGFTSQYHHARGRVHFGSIAGPLSRHILIRDWTNHMTQRERYELLAHELGHYLGATHSVDPHSIMRPVIMGNLPPNSVGFHPFRFDPVNALLINLYASELRQQKRPSVWRFSVARKKQIRDIYAHMEECFPGDDAAGRLKEYIAQSISKPRTPRPEPPEALSEKNDVSEAEASSSRPSPE